jgi:hypothetical protein
MPNELVGLGFVIVEDSEEVPLAVSDRFPDGGLSFSELLMIERIYEAYDHLRERRALEETRDDSDIGCDFELACEVLRFIGWDEKRQFAVVLSQDDVDQVVTLLAKPKGH